MAMNNIGPSAIRDYNKISEDRKFSVVTIEKISLGNAAQGVHLSGEISKRHQSQKYQVQSRLKQESVTESLSIYIYIYTHTHIYIHTHTHTHTHIYICIVSLNKIEHPVHTSPYTSPYSMIQTINNKPK